VNRDHDRFGEALQAIDHLLPRAGQRRARFRRCDPGEFLDIGARHEVFGFAGDEHHRPGFGIVLDPPEQRFELLDDRGAEHVHRLTRDVEGEDGDAVGLGQRECVHDL
jgi:hypothetical protein